MINAYNATTMIALLAVLGTIDVAGPDGTTVVTLGADGRVTSVGPWWSDVAARTPSNVKIRAVTVSEIVDGARYGHPAQRYLEQSHYAEIAGKGDGIVTFKSLRNVTSDAIR